MTAVGPVSNEHVVNQALANIGYRLRISNLYDGSAAAAVALDVFVQTRDELLREGDYDFSSRQVTANLLKQAPAQGYVPPTQWSSAYPPLGYPFEYEYPADCLKVRSLRPTALWVPNFDPQPQSFAIYNDAGYDPPRKVILAYIGGAILTYTAQIQDPSTWEPSYTKALIAALGEKLAPALNAQNAQAMEADKIGTAEAVRATAGAESVQG